MDGGIHLWRWKESAAVLLQLVLEFFFLLGTSSLDAGRKKHTWESETKSSEPDSGEQNKLSPCLSVYLALRMPLFHSLFLCFFSPHLLTRDSERAPAALNLISSLHKSYSVSINQIFLWYVFYVEQIMKSSYFLEIFQLVLFILWVELEINYHTKAKWMNSFPLFCFYTRLLPTVVFNLDWQVEKKIYHRTGVTSFSVA